MMMPAEREGKQAAEEKPGRRLPLLDPDKLAVLMRGASGRDWRVLLHLATFADWGNGANARPASSTLAEDLELDKSDVCKALKRLSARGVIVALSPATPRKPAAWTLASVVRPSKSAPGKGSRPPSGGSFRGPGRPGGGVGRPTYDMPERGAEEKKREAAARLHEVKVRFQSHKLKCREARCRDCAGFEREIAAREGRS